MQVRVRTALVTLLLNTVLTVLKFVAFAFTGSLAILNWSQIELGCPDGLQPYRFLANAHVDVALAYAAAEAGADWYLLNAFAGPVDVWCPSIAAESGWHAFDGSWVADNVALVDWGSDFSSNCNLTPYRDPIPISPAAGFATISGTPVLYQDSEWSTAYPVLCTELDGWAP